jgi:hypothetical protein
MVEIKEGNSGNWKQPKKGIQSKSDQKANERGQKSRPPTYSNIRIGMFLEIATTVGALFGASVAAKLSTPKTSVKRGTMTIPPPSPGNDPKNPATREPNATTAVNSRVFKSIAYEAATFSPPA